MKWAEVQAHPCRCDGRLNPNHVFSSGMLVHRSCALHRCLCRRLYCWCWPLSFSQSLHLRSFQTCTLIPLDFSKQAINSVDSTFVTRLLLTVKLNCATTCLFSTFHWEGRRTESCSTVWRISSLCQILAYVHHNFSLGTNSKTKQTKKGGEAHLSLKGILYTKFCLVSIYIFFLNSQSFSLMLNKKIF